MNQFIFKYGNLLGVKEKYEELIQGKLNSALKALEDERERLQEYETTREKYKDIIHAKIQLGTELMDVRNCDGYIRTLDKRIFQQLEVIQKCNQKVETLRIELLKASKERKTFEKLKEKGYEDFCYNEKKLEEKFVDQLVTFKNFRKN